LGLGVIRFWQGLESLGFRVEGLGFTV